MAIGVYRIQVKIYISGIRNPKETTECYHTTLDRLYSGSSIFKNGQ